MTPLSTGMPLAERYLLIEQLGAGGMSVVWRGFDDVLGRPVAVKVLSAPTAADPAFRAAIRKEARASARLSHPNITQVYDYGDAELPDGPTVSYVVMELLDGQTLGQRLIAGALPWREAVDIAAQVAQALAAAHRRGIVHRDIAPANVMLTATGAKVLDFGIAALAGGRGDPDGGGLLGTPAYVAPERLDDAPAAPAADVYGLGVLLFEMLTGEPPVPAKTWTALVEAYRTGPADIPELAVPGLPDSVRDVVRRCLVANPAARPGTAEVAQILVDARAAADPARTPTRAAAALSVTRLLPQVEEPLLEGAGSAEEAAGRSRRLALGVAVTAVVVLITAALLAAVFADRGQPQTGPTLPSAGLASSAGTGATASASPSTPPSTTASAPVVGPASPSGHPSPSSSPVAPLVVVDQLITQVQTDADAGQIRPDVALDLENVLHQLRGQIIGEQPINYPQWVSNFRTKISQRIGEQAITESSGMRLLSLVDQLNNAGG